MRRVHPPACRVTVQGPLRRLDLVVPATTPVAELLPDMVALGVGGADGAGDPVRPWRLSRALGPDLAPDRSLREEGVRDGDLLLLRHESAPPLGVLRSDPVVALAAEVDRAPGRWTAERRTSLALALLAPALLALLVAGDRVAAPLTTALLGALATAVLLLAAVASRAEGRTALALAALSVLPAGAAGWEVARALELGRPGSLAWVSGTALAVCLAGSRCARATRRPLIGLATVLLAALLLSALSLTGAGPVRVAAVGLVVAVATVPLVPPYALRVAGVVRTGGATGSTGAGTDSPAQRAQGARLVVTWFVGALAPLVAVLAGVAAGDGGLCGRWLAGVAGLTLLLRARSALFTAEVVALALAGASALVCAVAGWVLAALSTSSPTPALLPLAALCLLALLLALPSTRAAVAAPATDRRLRQLEAAGLLALVPLVLGVLGVFGAVADAASGLR